jgi:pyruvate carboxylase subunit B
MHPAQYRNYRSGVAKKALDKELAEKREEAQQVSTPAAAPAVSNGHPKTMNINVNGSDYRVTVSYGESSSSAASSAATTVATAPAPAEVAAPAGEGEEVISPLEGTFYLTKEKGATAKKVGDKIAKGEPIGFIEAMKVYNAIAADRDGTITWLQGNGTTVEEDDVIAKIG